MDRMIHIYRRRLMDGVCLHGQIVEIVQMIIGICGHIYRADNSATTNFSDDLYIGAIMYGEYFDFPANVDVGYSVAYDYDETEQKRSLGGSDYSTIRHYGSPMWAYTPAWTVYASTTNIGAHQLILIIL